nr:universal stress protein [Thermoleophilaceae bacterium]
MAKILVVANRTAESDELLEQLRKRVEQGEAELHLLVPSTPQGLQRATNVDADSGGIEAQEQLEKAVERIRGKGVEFDSAVVGDPDPLAAIQDAANLGDYDEIIVST